MDRKRWGRLSYKSKFGWGLAFLAALIFPWILLTVVGDSVETDSAQEVEEPPLVALTFDDGPRRDTTSVLLDGLAERGVHATFFVVGKQVGGNEDLVRRMEAEGHQVGCHTFDHVKLSGLNDTDFDAQVGRTRRLLSAILGHEGFALRPPYGFTDEGVERRAGSPVILWSVDPEDWGDKNVERIVNHVVERAEDGDIILLHDIYPTSVEAALEIVDRLHEKGFLFLTVDGLCQAKGLTPGPGQRLRSVKN